MIQNIAFSFVLPEYNNDCTSFSLVPELNNNKSRGWLSQRRSIVIEYIVPSKEDPASLNLYCVLCEIFLEENPYMYRLGS